MICFFYVKTWSNIVIPTFSEKKKRHQKYLSVLGQLVAVVLLLRIGVPVAGASHTEAGLRAVFGATNTFLVGLKNGENRSTSGVELTQLTGT